MAPEHDFLSPVAEAGVRSHNGFDKQLAVSPVRRAVIDYAYTKRKTGRAATQCSRQFPVRPINLELRQHAAVVLLPSRSSQLMVLQTSMHR